MKKMTKWIETIISILIYPKIIKQLKSNTSNLFFIFPCYEIGGGERVHVEIMNTVSSFHPTCIITNISKSNDMKEEFETVSKLINLRRWGSKKSFKERMLKKISKVINETPNAVVFSCNSHFFYDLLPLLSHKVKKIDLMHTYHGDSDPFLSFEHYSLPVTHKLDQRVVLGQEQKAKLANFYKERGIKTYPETVVIHNQVSAPEKIQLKDIPEVLNILFVARNRFEKRPQLLLEIAREAHIRGLPYHFTMIGDFEEFKKTAPQNVSFTGTIKSKAELNPHYKNAHVILVTSLFEGFPMVLLEAMAHGVVPISTRVGEVPNFINEQFNTGFIVDNHSDENAIKNDFITILTSLANDTQKIHQISLHVQNLVKNEFSKETFTRKYYHLLTESFQSKT